MGVSWGLDGSQLGQVGVRQGQLGVRLGSDRANPRRFTRLDDCKRRTVVAITVTDINQL